MASGLQDEEQQRLLATDAPQSSGYGGTSPRVGKSLKQIRFSEEVDVRAPTPEFDKALLDWEHEVVFDVARYRTQTFITWSCFGVSEKTVWRHPKLWQMMGLLAFVSSCTVVLTVLVVRQPHVLRVGKFTNVSKFLNVVVGLLLGFFLSSSMNRWYTCVNGFLELLDAIRNLQMQFIALGVPEKDTLLCIRYGLLSGWLLYFTLLHEAQSRPERDVMWDNLRGKRSPTASPGRTATASCGEPVPFLSDVEMAVLKRTQDPPSMLWIWVSGLIGRLAQDKIIPPMASPTYGRIMNLCQSAHTGIRQVNASMKVQAPLIYTHMMATLVHINNLLNAVTFGMVLGLSLGTWLQHHRVHPVWPATDADLDKESQRDAQTAIVTFMYSFFGPLIYQALLIISMALAQPFHSEEATIPLDRFLGNLEKDLSDGFIMAENFAFEKPRFASPA